jgi:hypothetical protein
LSVFSELLISSTKKSVISFESSTLTSITDGSNRLDFICFQTEHFFLSIIMLDNLVQSFMWLLLSFYEKCSDKGVWAFLFFLSQWIDREGRTPLIVACMSPELVNVAKTLIELGANVNAYRPGMLVKVRRCPLGH